MLKFIGWLKTESAIFIVICLALVAQMSHAQAEAAAHLHEGLSRWSILLQSWTYAIALESLALAFALRGKTWQSWFFAAISFCVNLSYYADSGITPTELLFSASIPMAIAMCSHLLNKSHGTLQVPRVIAQIPILFSDAMEHIRFASNANEGEPSEEDAAPAPVPVELPHPKEPEPIPAERPQNEGSRFHDLPTKERQPLVKKMKEQRKLNNNQLAKMFDVSPATISRDLNS